LPNRQTASGGGSAYVDRLGGERQHDRCFGAACVGVAVPWGGMPCAAGTALIGQPTGGRCQRFGTASVPVDQQPRLPVEACMPAQLDQAACERGGSDGQRARETSVLPARADGDGWRQRYPALPGTGPPRYRDGDPGVCIEWQVRTMLLERSDRHDEHL